MNVSEEQMAAIEQGEAVSITVGKTDCVVLRKDVYQKIQQIAYDDSDWSDKEMEALAADMFDGLDNPQEIK
jgi:hypothetical protein